MGRKKTVEPPNDIAQWVVAVRAKLTQQEFADRIHKDRVTVNSWETGAAAPKPESIQAIIRTFPGCPSPPGFTSLPVAGEPVSVPYGKVLPIAQALGGALERRAKGLTGEQVLRAQQRIRDQAPRLTALVLDQAGADQLLAVLLEDFSVPPR